ncbi:MAG TPA: F0F1 ATP synthase subunit alpha, partial [Thermoanaerobaculia bacterium]
LDLAAFRDLEAFAQLGTELDPATQRQLDRGLRMVELLKQPQYRPYPLAEQVVSIYAGTQGFLDELPAHQVARFEEALLKHVRDEHPEVLDEINRTGELSDALAATLRKVIADFKTHWK